MRWVVGSVPLDERMFPVPVGVTQICTVAMENVSEASLHTKELPVKRPRLESSIVSRGSFHKAILALLSS